MKKRFYLNGREMVYIDVKPRILAKKYIVDELGDGLKDYKFFCFNGLPKLMYIASNKFEETKFDFFDVEYFNHIPVRNGYQNSNKKIKMPKNYREMLELCNELAKDIPFVRIDFYDSKDGIYFGEMTFYHMNGFTLFDPEEYDYKFVSMINLNNL